VCAATKKKFNSFDDMVKNSELPLLVDFYATWCGPCVMMAQVLEVRCGSFQRCVASAKQVNG
jgi:thioredoxin-like negative regulator of GroEL